MYRTAVIIGKISPNSLICPGGTGSGTVRLGSVQFVLSVLIFTIMITILSILLLSTTTGLAKLTEFKAIKISAFILTRIVNKK